VGWYLIGPPIRFPKHDEAYLDEQAEYRDWKVFFSFKTQDQCEATRNHIARVTRRGEQIIFPNNFPHPRDSDNATWLAQQADVECIASDDPRLKGKKETPSISK
jgi:hypothetical protein